MSDVTLTAAVRQNLLSLQSTADLISRTQNRLSTGLKVSKAVDDPVNFFQAKGLTDRAADFDEKKTLIDQGISTVTAATDAIAGIENLVAQLKGLANNAKSATTTTEINNIVTQFNELRTQIDLLATDASYQGLNLVAGTGSTLSVYFSNETSSVLSVKSSDVRSSNDGLAITKISALDTGAKMALHTLAHSVGTIANGEAFTMTVAGTSTHTLAGGNTFAAQIGTQAVVIKALTSATGDTTMTNYMGFMTQGTYSVGGTVVFTLETAGTSGGTGKLSLSSSSESATEQAAIRIVGVGTSDELNLRVQNLDSALTTLRSRAKVLGANVAILNTRLDFTKDYVNTLTAGAGKLTLADLNAEGANLLALQTRQQLGVQSLAFAGQSEQSILGLFR